MKTVDRKLLVYAEAVKQSMSTYVDFYSASDIDYVINTLFSVDEIAIEKVAKICIRTYILSNTGRYSFSFNSVFRRSIRERNADNVIILSAMDEREAFPELYSNTELTDLEYNTISSIIQREYLSSINTLEIAVSASEDMLYIFGKKTSLKESLYTKAYRYVHSQELSSGILPILDSVPEKVYIMGESYSNKQIQIEEVEYMTFMWKLIDNDNEFRKVRIKQEILDFMKKRKSAETKLCNYWLHNKV